MTALGAAALWFVIATIVAMTPSRDYHWRAAYVLMAFAAVCGLWFLAGAAVFLVVVRGLVSGLLGT